MKNILLLMFVVTLLASCKKEPCYDCYSVHDTGWVDGPDRVCSKKGKNNWINREEEWPFIVEAYCDEI